MRSYQINNNIAENICFILELDKVGTFIDTKYPSIRGYQPKIMELGAITFSQTDDYSSSSDSVSVKLSDDDGTLYELVRQMIVENILAKIYILSSSENLVGPIFTGRVGGDYIWDEGERSLSINLISAKPIIEIPYAPEAGDIDYLIKEAENVCWPMCFGKPVHVPAVKIRDVTSTTLGPVTPDTKEVKIKDWRRYPQGGEEGIGPIIDPNPTPGWYRRQIKLQIGNILFKGYMEGDTFHIYDGDVGHNLAYYTGLKFAEREHDTNSDLSVQGEEGSTLAAEIDDYDNPYVGWVPDGVYLMGKYVLYKYPVNDTEVLRRQDTSELLGTEVFIRDAYAVNFCTCQVGSKCYFDKPFLEYDKESYTFPDTGWDIIDVAGEPIARWPATYSWSKDYSVYTNSGLDKDNRMIGVQNSRVCEGECTSGRDYKWDLMHSEDESSIIVDTYILPTGSKTILWDDEYCDTYICNSIPSESIIGVYGTRKIKGSDDKQLVPIPYYYWIEKLDTDEYNDEKCTSIEFPMPLSARLGEDWDDDIYVTLESSIGSKPFDVISTLLVDYAGYSVVYVESVDSTRIESMKMNFCITDKHNVVDLCMQLCFEACCALRYSGNEASIVNLREKSVDATITPDMVKMSSIKLGAQSIEDTLTRLHAYWAEDYYVQDKEIAAYKNSTNLWYGIRKKEFDILSFNTERDVLYFAEFWGHRLSNIWRKTSYKLFLNNLGVEPFDILTTNIGYINGASGLVEKVSINPDDCTIDIDLVVDVLVSNSELTSDEQFWTGWDSGVEGTTETYEPADKYSLSDELIEPSPEKIQTVNRTTTGSSPTSKAQHVIVVPGSLGLSYDAYNARKAHNNRVSSLVTLSKENGVIVFNPCTYSIPSFSAAEICGMDSKRRYLVTMPRSNSLKSELVLFNGINEIKPKSSGIMYSASRTDIFTILGVDSPQCSSDSNDTGTVNMGQEVGTRAGSWALAKEFVDARGVTVNLTGFIVKGIYCGGITNTIFPEQNRTDEYMVEVFNNAHPGYMVGSTNRGQSSSVEKIIIIAICDDTLNTYYTFSGNSFSNWWATGGNWNVDWKRYQKIRDILGDELNYQIIMICNRFYDPGGKSLQRIRFPYNMTLSSNDPPSDWVYPTGLNVAPFKWVKYPGAGTRTVNISAAGYPPRVNINSRTTSLAEIQSYVESAQSALLSDVLPGCDACSQLPKIYVALDLDDATMNGYVITHPPGDNVGSADYGWWDGSYTKVDDPVDLTNIIGYLNGLIDQGYSVEYFTRQTGTPIMDATGDNTLAVRSQTNENNMWLAWVNRILIRHFGIGDQVPEDRLMDL